jgi:hypothetical protein
VACCAFWCFARTCLAVPPGMSAGLAVKRRWGYCEASTLQACEWTDSLYITRARRFCCMS